MNALVKLVLVLVIGVCACIPPRRHSATFNAPATAGIVVQSLAIAPLIDARPASGRRTHEPVVSKYTGLALVYFAFGTGRTDGAVVPGDDYTDITIGGRRGSVSEQMGAYVASVVGGLTGQVPGAAPGADLGDVRRAAADRPDGITVVPILDQFDVYSMRSEDSITGGSSYQSGNKQVTTSGYAAGSARTDDFANLRLRLVLLETRGGQVVKQATAYVATSGRSLDDVLSGAVQPIRAQLAAFTAK